MSSQQGQNKGEMLVAEVVRLADLVNYQEGSVVSRTIVKRATGTITLFAFDNGQGLSEHTAAFDAVGASTGGRGGNYDLWQGAPDDEAILMPVNKPHSLRAIGQFKMLLTMIRS
jgi:quercetin dioxygenase-like cupin family protein